MLEHLRARNLGLIREAAIDPDPGLTVITGETGAGKTLLLGAIRLLLGETADPGAVGPFGDAAQADGVLSDGEELGVARVVPSEGRSRSYVDGVVTSTRALAERVGSRIEIVGQHDQLRLKSRRHVLDMVDSALDREGLEALARYRTAWGEFQSLSAESGQLGGSETDLVRELDLLRYQQGEIAAAGLSVGDDLALEAQEARLRNARQIREHLDLGETTARAIDQAAGELVSSLRRVGELDPGSLPLSEAAQTLAVLAAELVRDLHTRREEVVEDPEVLARIEGRLNQLGDLKRKYGKSIEEIIEFGARAAAKADSLERLIARAATIGAELAERRRGVELAAAELSQARRRAAEGVGREIVGHLADLGLGEATASFQFEATEPGASGGDRVEILFSSHPGLAPGPLAKVASGGELSRLILAVSLATSQTSASTLVFDEVDAGIGGATALAMGRKLAALGKGRQVLCVTHLPQVAAYADAHYTITRDGDEATVQKVSGADRVEELARMIAGLPESERGRQAASELLDMSGK